MTTLSKLYQVQFRMQCSPSTVQNAVFIEYSSECSVHRVQFGIQCSPSTVRNVVFTEYSSESSVHRVQFRMQYSPSHQSEQCLPSEFLLPSLQWLPSSELLKSVSMNRAFTSTECMMMPGNTVDAEYQKVTESVH